MSKPTLMDMLMDSEKRKNFIQHSIGIILVLIGIVVLLSLVVFTCMLFINQNDFRSLSRNFLEQGEAEVETILYYINTIHSTLAVVDHTHILALVYSLLSTLCIGVGVYFLKVVYSRQKDLSDKAKAIEERFESLEMKDKFNSTCNVIYHHCTLLKLFHCIEKSDGNRELVENSINECLVRIRIALKDCLNLAERIKEKQRTSSNEISLYTLGNAKTALDDFGEETGNDEFQRFAESIQKILDVLR